MKKLLCALTSTMLVTTGIITPLATIGNNPQTHTDNIEEIEDGNKENKDDEQTESKPEIENPIIDVYSTNSFSGIVKIINTKYNKRELLENKEAKSMIEDEAGTYFEKIFDNKIGNLNIEKIETTNNEKILSTSKKTFLNNTDDEQTFNAGSYSKEITNVHKFFINSLDNYSFSSSFKIPFLGKDNEVEFKIDDNKKWNGIKYESKNIYNSNQTIKTAAHSKLEVLYTIKQTVNIGKGVISYQLNNLNKKEFAIPHLQFTDEGECRNPTFEQFSILDIINTLKELGYGEFLKNDYNQYSIITVDDIANPTSVTINLPITWESEVAQFELSITEESLS